MSDLVWKGPGVDGITFSLLSRYLACKERFRNLVMYGLRPVERFNHRIAYGQLWHVCEAALAGGQDWQVQLLDSAAKMCKRYLEQQLEILHWVNVLRVQFPVYINYWKSYECPFVPVLQEEVFDEPYRLPDGRIARLRGCWDAVHLEKKRQGFYVLQENKTKGQIDEQKMKEQLASGFDLQTMIYLAALQNRNYNIGGVYYNVVRRPLSGGRHTIRQLQPSKKNPQGETQEEYYARLHDLIAGEPDYFFMRWYVDVTNSDVNRFREQCLDPLLMELWDWWDFVSRYPHSWPTASTCGPYHYRMPYGVYNPIIEGGNSDLDEYLDTGSELGLERTVELFPELQGDRDA